MQIKKIKGSDGKTVVKIQLLRSKYSTDAKRGTQVSLGVYPPDVRLSEEEMASRGLTDVERLQLAAYFAEVEKVAASEADEDNAKRCHTRLQMVCDVLRKGTYMDQEKLLELQRDVEDLKTLLHRRGMRKKMVAAEKMPDAPTEPERKNDTEAPSPTVA